MDELETMCLTEYPRLVGMLGLYCGEADRAEDLAQEALIRLCRDWPGVRKMDAPVAWLRRVALNLAHSHYRRRKIEMRLTRLSGRPVHHVDPGEELIIWGGLGDVPTSPTGAAYDPSTDSWRALSEGPLPSGKEPVCMTWTGTEVFIWGWTSRPDGSRDGALYDPADDSWRSTASAPRSINQGFCEWAFSRPGDTNEIIVFGSDLDGNNGSSTEHAVGMAYNPVSNSWRELPESKLSPQASAIGWTGEELIAWDYALNAASYDPSEDRWSDLPDVPGRFQECYPQSTEVNRYVLAWYCGQAALWDTTKREWISVPTPNEEVPGPPVTAGEVVTFAGGETPGSHWIYVAPARP